MKLAEKITDAIIEQIVQETIALASRNLIGWNKSHKVLYILKKAGVLDLQNDLTSIYLYTLAEYSVDRSPMELVKVFADKTVRAAFENDFYKKSDGFANAVLKCIDDHFEIRRLKDNYPNLANPHPEIEAFQKMFRGIMDKATTPALLAYFNEANENIRQLLEEKHRNSFEGQVEQYLDKQIAAFQQKYLEGGKYVDLNGQLITHKWDPRIYVTLAIRLL